jgi:diphthine-ammonia ligase
MNIPIIKWYTKGEKELELVDLKNAVKKVKDEYNIETIVTGAIQSIYQVSRIKKICEKLDVNCFNPLWQKNQIQLLQELVKNKFEIIIIGVFAYPLDEKCLGRKIDKKFIEDAKKLQEKYNINPAGEGGEFETFVVNCPLFEKKLIITDKEIIGKKNSWKMEIDVK